MNTAAWKRRLAWLGFYTNALCCSGRNRSTAVTRPVLVTGPRLTLNVDTGAGGSVYVEILDESADNPPIDGFALAQSLPTVGNDIALPVLWQKLHKFGNRTEWEKYDMQRLVGGRPFRLRFTMVGTKLYSFAFSNLTTRQKIDDEIHGAGRSAPWTPSPKCQAEADASCIKPCYDQIKSRPCDGPMVARDSTAVGQNVSRWRCYSPSTLTPDNKHYAKGNCYCSDVPIRETLKKCGDPDPTPLPPSPPKPPPPAPPALIPGATMPFKAGTEGYTIYRIPALLSLSAERRILFAEGRGQDADHGKVDVVFKISTSGGSSWSGVHKLYGESNATHSTTIGNPSPVVDAKHPGHIVLTCCRNNKDVLLLRSTDRKMPTPSCALAASLTASSVRRQQLDREGHRHLCLSRGPRLALGRDRPSTGHPARRRANGCLLRPRAGSRWLGHLFALDVL